jgi:hypothetical protein
VLAKTLFKEFLIRCLMRWRKIRLKLLPDLRSLHLSPIMNSINKNVSLFLISELKTFLETLTSMMRAILYFSEILMEI